MGKSGPLERARLPNGIQDLRFRTAEKLEEKTERDICARVQCQKKKQFVACFSDAQILCLSVCLKMFPKLPRSSHFRLLTVQEIL